MITLRILEKAFKKRLNELFIEILKKVIQFTYSKDDILISIIKGIKLIRLKKYILNFIYL